MSNDCSLRGSMKTRARRFVLLVLIAIDLSSPASAEDTLDGKWQISWMPTFSSQCAGGGDIKDRPCEATLFVSGASGTMRRFGTGFQKREDPCIGIAYPVTVELRADLTAAILKINGSAVLRGCPDFTLSLKLLEGGVSEARMGDGALVNTRR